MKRDSPNTSGRLRARPTRLREISSSDALVVSRILDSIASRCCFHRGSISEIRMCSAIWSTGIISPVIGDSTIFVAAAAAARARGSGRW